MPIPDVDSTGDADLDRFLRAFVAWVESDCAARPRPVRTPHLRAAALEEYKTLIRAGTYADVIGGIELSLPPAADVLAACAVAWAGEVSDRSCSSHAASHFLTCFYTVCIDHYPQIRASWC